jgi:putative peptidoglycan lipid II flippase
VFRHLRDSITRFIFKKQPDILSAALILAIATTGSRILGLIRDRALAQFFSGGEIGVYFAAFRLPDTLFEILILGTLSAAFIPTFVSYISKGKEREAWRVASISMTVIFLFFALLALVIFLTAHPLSKLLAPGFTPDEVKLMASMTRVLLLSQGFFVLSLFLTGVLKSFQRFLVPAVAPIFYNLGIVAAIVFLAERWGIYAPVWGAVFGSLVYFAIHVPLARHLGFRFSPSLDISHPGVRRIMTLAAPRTLEIIFAQILKASDLFFASLISVASYGYFTFASHLALIPVSLVGVSLADAALPALSYERGNSNRFRETLLSVFRQLIFLATPLSVTLIVLRVPAVRLAFGADRFTWESTVLTGFALSAFALGVFSQAATALMVRAFYALSDTLTPVKVGVSMVLVNIAFSGFFVLILKTPVWGVSLAFALSNIFQMAILVCLLAPRVGAKLRRFVYPSLRVGVAALLSGGVMYVLLKVLDRSAWDSRLSFLGYLSLPEPFEYFILDTRYTVNLIVLTFVVAVVGAAVYLLAAKILGVKELSLLGKLWRRLVGLASHRSALPPQSSGGESELT